MNPTLLMMACVLVAEPQKDQAFREDSLGSGGRYESTRVDPARPTGLALASAQPQQVSTTPQQSRPVNSSPDIQLGAPINILPDYFGSGATQRIKEQKGANLTVGPLSPIPKNTGNLEIVPMTNPGTVPNPNNPGFFVPIPANQMANSQTPGIAQPTIATPGYTQPPYLQNRPPVGMNGTWAINPANGQAGTVSTFTPLPTTMAPVFPNAGVPAGPASNPMGGSLSSAGTSFGPSPIAGAVPANQPGSMPTPVGQPVRFLSDDVRDGLVQTRNPNPINVDPDQRAPGDLKRLGTPDQKNDLSGDRSKQDPVPDAPLRRSETKVPATPPQDPPKARSNPPPVDALSPEPKKINTPAPRPNRVELGGSQLEPLEAKPKQNNPPDKTIGSPLVPPEGKTNERPGLKLDPADPPSLKIGGKGNETKSDELPLPVGKPAIKKAAPPLENDDFGGPPPPVSLKPKST